MNYAISIFIWHYLLSASFHLWPSVSCSLFLFLSFFKRQRKNKQTVLYSYSKLWNCFFFYVISFYCLQLLSVFLFLLNRYIHYWKLCVCANIESIQIHRPLNCFCPVVLVFCVCVLKFKQFQFSLRKWIFEEEKKMQILITYYAKEKILNKDTMPFEESEWKRNRIHALRMWRKKYIYSCTK